MGGWVSAHTAHNTALMHARQQPSLPSPPSLMTIAVSRRNEEKKKKFNRPAALGIVHPLCMIFFALTLAAKANARGGTRGIPASLRWVPQATLGPSNNQKAGLDKSSSALEALRHGLILLLYIPAGGADSDLLPLVFHTSSFSSPSGH